MHKSKELIAEIQARETSPQAYPRSLQENALVRIEGILETCRTMDSQRHEKLLTKEGPRGITVHPDPKHKSLLEEILRPSLDDHLKEPYSIDFAFHQNKFPYGIHTDSGYDENEQIYKQGIIPLDVSPKEASVYTVIFKEKVYHSTGFPLKDTSVIVRGCSVEPLQNMSGHTEKIESYLLPPEASQLTVALPFKWKRGSMAIWDRAHLHCSSLFAEAGIESKTGLMWITRRV